MMIMNAMKPTLKQYIIVGCLSLMGVLAGCASSGPATQYYSLFPDKNACSNMPAPDIDKATSLGIGPVILPEYLDYPSVVSLTESSQVRVAGYHAWAGNLAEAIDRVMVENVSTCLGMDNVWKFPWDTRTRPNHQVRVVLEEFSGIRGGEVTMVAKWTLLDKRGENLIAMGKESFTVNTSDARIDTYVQALNQLLNQTSEAIAQKIMHKL